MITPQQLYEKNNIKQYYTAHNAIVSIVNDTSVKFRLSTESLHHKVKLLLPSIPFKLVK